MANVKNIILKKQLEGVLYDLMVKTSADQIVTNYDSKTLSTVLAELFDKVGDNASSEDLQQLKNKFDNLVQDAPEAYDTLVEIGTYISTHQDEYQALVALVGNKVEAVEGKGLSTEDFTTAYKTKLDALFTKAELDEKFEDIDTATTANTSAIAKNTAAIAAINNAETGILAVSKAYTDTEVAKKARVIVAAQQPEDLTEADIWMQIIE